MQKLVQGLHRFQSDVFAPRRDFFSNLARGQNPEALFITCSDSRIAPNLITQTDPGDLFILRNAGNIVPPHAAGAACGETATIEFAVEHLEVSSIVVCGHTCCGAMKALLDPPESLDGLPAVKSWLAHAEPTRRRVLERYADRDPSTLATIMVEENVLTQIEHLHTHPVVERRLLAGKLAIYAWVYKIETGEVFQYDTVTGQYERLDGEARPTVTRLPVADPHPAVAI